MVSIISLIIPSKLIKNYKSIKMSFPQFTKKKIEIRKHSPQKKRTNNKLYKISK